MSMPEHCTYELGLAILRSCQINSASTCGGNWSTYEYVFSKRRNLLSTERVEKLVLINIYTGFSVTLFLAKDLPVQLQSPVVHY